MTFISQGELWEIENNLEKKEEKDIIFKLESLNEEIEQGMKFIVDINKESS
jgi:hypothetical protein